MNRIIFALLISVKLATLQNADAAEPTAACKEACASATRQSEADLERCQQNAKNIKDLQLSIQAKQNCRKRYRAPNCEQLAACQSSTKQKAYQELSATYEMGDLSVIPSGRDLVPKEEVRLQYTVKILTGTASKAWFSQDTVIVDANSNIVFQENHSLKPDGEMVSSFQFETKFKIPENFQAGSYTLKFRLRENFTRWETAREMQLRVKPR